MSETIRPGRKPINPGSRTSFMFSPSREIAAQVEEFCQLCRMPANAVLTQLVTYALNHAAIRDVQAKEMFFVD